MSTLHNVLLVASMALGIVCTVGCVLSAVKKMPLVVSVLLGVAAVILFTVVPLSVALTAGVSGHG